MRLDHAYEHYLQGLGHAFDGAGRWVDVQRWQPEPGASLRRGPDGKGWVRAGRNASSTFKTPSSDLLNRFANLWKASDAEIVDFAREWGLLWLCEKHWMPISPRGHAVITTPPPDENTFWRWREEELEPDWHYPRSMWISENAAPGCEMVIVEHRGRSAECEPADGWRLWSGIVSGILDIAIALNSNRRARPDAWRRVQLDPDGFSSINHERNVLLAYIHWVTRIAALDLTLTWGGASSSAPRLVPQLTTDSLFAGIVGEMTSAVATPARIALCAVCNNWFAPRRKKRSDAMQDVDFCPSCIEGEETKRQVEAYRSNAYYQRQKAGQTIRKPRKVEDGATR